MDEYRATTSILNTLSGPLIRLSFPVQYNILVCGFTLTKVYYYLVKKLKIVKPRVSRESLKKISDHTQLFRSSHDLVYTIHNIICKLYSSDYTVLFFFDEIRRETRKLEQLWMFFFTPIFSYAVCPGKIA